MATLDSHLPPKTPRPPITNPVPSSSPAFATPLHPIRPANQPQVGQSATTAANGDAVRSAPILPILLPPATLRPIAFRTFTKKHNLNLTSPALQLLATFVGRQCGASWREEGLGELVLEEVAKSWKRLEAATIVEGGESLKNILKQLEGSMSGGRIIGGKRGPLSRQGSFARADATGDALQRQDSFGMSTLEVGDEDEDEGAGKDPRRWLKVVDAFEQPRLTYNAARKHFEKSKTPASFFPPPSHKTELFRQRYHLIHQRVLRNESFQTPTIIASAQQQWKITSIANLLGRSGTGHLLLGHLTITPTGTLAISDLTGSIDLTLEQATSIDSVETWLCPGMIVLVDGVYEEEYNHSGGNLSGVGGVGGTLGGRFVGFSIGAPRCETRAMTLGLSDTQSLNGLNIGGGHGWVDFLGLGSERAVGTRMRKIEQRLLDSHAVQGRVNSTKIVVVGDCNLDNPQTLSALRQILLSYSPGNASSAMTESTPPPSEPSIPLAFVLLGNFTTHAAMSSTSTSSYANASSTTSTSAGIADSITYKESFDALALLLSDFPALLRHSTWVFVPGDNDPWASAFSAGAAVPLPRQGVPDVFTSRLKRAFAAANADPSSGVQGPSVNRKGDRAKGEAIWTSNPSRLSLFGPSCELVLFRDDISGRMRRNAIPLKNKAGNDEDQDRETTTEDSGVHTVPHDPATVEVTMSGALPANDGDAEGDAARKSQNQSQDPDAMETDIPTTAETPTPGPAQADKNRNDRPAERSNTQRPPTTTPAQSLAKTLLDQSTLSPFPLHKRPLHWDYAPSALSLYPLPTALVLCDAEMDAFALTYQGCTVLNAGAVVSRHGSSVGGGGSRGVGARWVEFDVAERRGCVRDM